MTEPARIARKLHGLIEPLHGFYYFARESRDAYEEIGLKGFAQCYVAGRAAPMGAVGPETATAAFFNFHPEVMEAGLPGAWEVASPATVLAARGRAVEAMLTRVEVPADGAAEATELAREAGRAADHAGRPLSAGNAGVAPTGTPLADLWQALTVLREHRGDGHVALLTSSGVGPVDALVMHTAWQPAVPVDFVQRSRRWDDDAWKQAVARLQDRGWLDDEAELTDEGATWRDGVEANTDALAAPPYEALGAASCRRLFDLLVPMVEALDASDAFPLRIRIPRPFGA